MIQKSGELPPKVGMRKFVFTVLMMVEGGIVYALPLGNPADPYLLSEGIICHGGWGEPSDPCAPWQGCISASFGFWGDYIFNRYTQVVKQDILDEDGFIIETIDDSDIYRTSIFTNAAEVTLNLWGRYQFFATLGTTHISIVTPGKSFANPFNSYVEIDTDTAFSVGVGGRVTLWGFGPFSVGAEASAIWSRPRINYVKDELASPIYLSKNEIMKYGDWQIGIGLSYDLYILSCSTLIVPYAGIKWSEARLNADELIAGSNILRTLESKRGFGYAVGATLVGSGMIEVTAEARFGDEKALFVNALVRY